MSPAIGIDLPTTFVDCSNHIRCVVTADCPGERKQHFAGGASFGRLGQSPRKINDLCLIAGA
jgi:hypothetical protein